MTDEREIICKCGAVLGTIPGSFTGKITYICGSCGKKRSFWQCDESGDLFPVSFHNPSQSAKMKPLCAFVTSDELSRLDDVMIDKLAAKKAKELLKKQAAKAKEAKEEKPKPQDPFSGLTKLVQRTPAEAPSCLTL